MLGVITVVSSEMERSPNSALSFPAKERLKKYPGKTVRFGIATCTNPNCTANLALFLHTRESREPSTPRRLDAARIHGVRIVGQHHEIRQLAGCDRGKDNMPSWYGILSDDEIEAIWAYVRATVDR